MMPELREIQDNYDNQIAYPCMVTVIVAQNQDLALTQAPTKWRQQLEEAFDFKQPAALAAALSDDLTLRRTEWQPLDVVDLEAFQLKNLLVSAAIVMVVVVKPR